MAQSNLKQPMSPSFNVGSSHSRSLSQPAFFANNCLPPLSPFPHNDSPLASSNSNLKDASMEEIDVSSSRGPPMPPSFIFRGNDNLPPRRAHRRSNSDVPLGFSDIIHSSPQLVPISRQGIFGKTENVNDNSGNEKPIGLKRREMDLIGDGKSEGQVANDLFNSFMSVESQSVLKNGINSREGVKRSAVGDIVPPARHYRSLSMDSGIMGNFHLGDVSPNSQSNQLSPSNSIAENSAKLNFDFGHGEFNEIELKKIMTDERLAEIAVSDPKRAKRILANRQSAARSKERKMRYISELEHKVQTLQTEATTLLTQVTMLQKDYAELINQNNELKFRVQAMEQQAQLRDALHDALTGEVQRLKLAKMEIRDEGRTSNGNYGIAQPVPMKNHMFQMQHQHQQQPNQMQRLSGPTSTTSSTASAAPTSA